MSWQAWPLKIILPACMSVCVCVRTCVVVEVAKSMFLLKGQLLLDSVTYSPVGM